jgi:uncharacterized protein
MQLENQFEVKAAPERVWDFLLDLERVTPCMPGAQLEELVDESTWKGKMGVKLGAVSLSYATTVEIAEKDEQARKVKLKASARETRGKGTANATIDSGVEPAENGASRVTMVTDLTISGAVAQYGRGMIGDVSKRLTGEFAKCLEANLLQEQEAAAAPQPAATAAAESRAPAEPEAPAPVKPAPVEAKPIGGIRLGLWAIWRAIVRFFRRLFGRGQSES